MSKFKRSQGKYVKRPYRVRNWATYDAGLAQRSSLTVWIDLDADARVVPGWNAPVRAHRLPGRPQKYSDVAIETAVTIGLVYHLPSRQTEGFLTSLFALLNLRAEVPDHTTVSRRKRSLVKQGLAAPGNKGSIHILIDSSGLRVHAGNLRKPPRNRDWRKLHLGVNELTGEIVACELTSKRARDAARVSSMLKQIDRPIASCRADSAYDEYGVYDAVERHSHGRSPRVLIPVHGEYPSRMGSLSFPSSE